MTNTDHLLRNRFVSVAYLPAKRPVIFVKSLLSDDCAEVFGGENVKTTWRFLREMFDEDVRFAPIMRFFIDESLEVNPYKLAA